MEITPLGELNHKQKHELRQILSNFITTVNFDDVFGIVGSVNLLQLSYLIIATKATSIGTINHNDKRHTIYRLDKVQMVPFSLFIPSLSKSQTELNHRYLSMVESVFETPNFYFSYTYDLTNTKQRLIQQQQNTSDKRFIWNHSLLENFEKSHLNIDQLKSYTLTLIFGFIAIKKLKLNSHLVKWILISRRNVKRAGTRFNTRGSDYDGNVANYVETEQIVECNSKLSSLVQIRASIPMVWRQFPTLEYKPKPVLDSNCDQTIPMKKHFDELTQNYGLLSIINLVDHKGHEGYLEQAFSDQVRYLSSNYYPILYHSFDFHRECSKMRWYRLEILMQQLHDELEQYGDFSWDEGTKQIISTQKGIMRTNCIDSLDRTNVVQSMIAKWVLARKLTTFGVLHDSAKLDDCEEFIREFRSTWADHADVISIQYAGTPALKTDFTRTGKRTHLGAIKDGINSLTRYFKNNFSDGFRQDSIDFFLGNYSVHPNEGSGLWPSPLQKAKSWKQIFLPSFFLGALSLFFFFTFTYRQNGLSNMLFCGVLLAFSMIMVLKNGSDLVDKPRLYSGNSRNQHSGNTVTTSQDSSQNAFKYRSGKSC